MLSPDRSLSYGRAIIERMTKRIAPFHTVLDLGAGSGNDLALAQQASPGAICHALDSYAPNVTMLRDRGVQVHPANLERDPFPFADGAVDLIIANQILEHLKEIFWVLHECSRTLAMDGHLLLGVPNLASLHNRFLLALGRQPTSIQNHSAHVRGYTRFDLERLLEMIFPGGYVLREFAGANFYPFPPAIAKPLARLLPNQAVAIFLLFQKKRAYAGEFLEHPIRQQLETNFYLGSESERFGHTVVAKDRSTPALHESLRCGPSSLYALNS